MALEFDFVVVGGGTAGCLLASRLANTETKPKVVLLEGGSDINKPEYRRTAERFSVIAQPGLDYGYVSTPQKHARNREVPQPRGKGLGGSSATNFQVWSLGAKEEFDKWAALAGDDSWAFGSVLERVKQLENLHLDGLSADWEEYVKPDPKNHGFSGPIDVSIGHVEKETRSFINAGSELGHKRNLDPNDGDPIGFSLNPTTSLNGVRTTGASAFLVKDRPDNLTVFTESRVVKIVFQGDRAVGVLREDGSMITAKKEVILSAGALDSPRLMLLSGIGPRSDLEALGIKVVKDLDGVGKSFTDHPMIVTCFQMRPGFTDRMELVDPAKYREAIKQLAESGNGPLLSHFSSVPHAFLKNLRAYKSPEFQHLSNEVQNFLLHPRVPSYEIVIGPLIPPNHVFEKPDDGFFSVFVANMNSVSQGQIRLSSSDPKDAALVDPGYLSNPYDLVNLREALREGLNLMKTPEMKTHFVRPIFAPKSDSDEDIVDFIEENVAGLFHPACSLKMGKDEGDGSCVNGDLKVHGLKGLRVADLSVPSTLPSGHPQIVAYVIGQIAAEKIRDEHGL
ncbi:GMC oxidoreductase [Colletotrichum graminicola M1.001]|uniref:GMC oxidoreductase n=1 Tax=Colletotrichum graminicola (strain M1.001 / M2 / FGSC 10212) TaxID=645133 RepID=E3Q8S8_COLGM|nr:GMC oxidoreductase [Colletotrichum graminicola M1.001]EFQ27442.1 GMC oxidoreductase [Colletotrichum graminicola M1.001]